MSIELTSMRQALFLGNSLENLRFFAAEEPLDWRLWFSFSSSLLSEPVVVLRQQRKGY